MEIWPSRHAIVKLCANFKGSRFGAFGGVFPAEAAGGVGRTGLEPSPCSRREVLIITPSRLGWAGSPFVTNDRSSWLFEIPTQDFAVDDPSNHEELLPVCTRHRNMAVLAAVQDRVEAWNKALKMPQAKRVEKGEYEEPGHYVRDGRIATLAMESRSALSRVDAGHRQMVCEAVSPSHLP